MGEVQPGRADLEELCRACGLCCDGSLFDFVPLLPTELESARNMRLPILASGKGFAQPCSMGAKMGASVTADRGCRIYADRPSACRAFVCKLHEAQRDLGGALEPRLAIVRRARELLRAPAKHGAELDVVMPNFDRAT